MADSQIPTLGRVREVQSDGSTARFEWRVPDGSHIRPGVCTSTIVSYFNTIWSLGLHKALFNVFTVHLRREYTPPGIPGSVRFDIVCRTPDGGQRDVARDEALAEDESVRSFCIPASTYHPGDFTFTCTLWKERSPRPEGVSPGTQTEDARCRKDEPHFKALSSLSEHFRNLLLSGDGHDVLVQVRERQFRAHRLILKARSPVFAAMFSIDMAENAGGCLTIEDCDPDVFGDFLQFVYCGAVDIATVGSALGLYYMGDKYDFPRLKEVCVEYLKNSFTTTSVFDVVSLATLHDEQELLQQALAYFASNLEAVLLTAEWKRFLSADPIRANAMSLKAVQWLKTSLYGKRSVD